MDGVVDTGEHGNRYQYDGGDTKIHPKGPLMLSPCGNPVSGGGSLYHGSV